MFNTKKVLSLVLAVAMLISTLPFAAFADDVPSAEISYWNADSTKITLDITQNVDAQSLANSMTLIKDGIEVPFTVEKKIPTTTATLDTSEVRSLDYKAANYREALPADTDYTYEIYPEGGMALGEMYVVTIKANVLGTQWKKGITVNKLWKETFDAYESIELTPWASSHGGLTLEGDTDKYLRYAPAVFRAGLSPAYKYASSSWVETKDDTNAAAKAKRDAIFADTGIVAKTFWANAVKEKEYNLEMELKVEPKNTGSKIHGIQIYFGDRTNYGAGWSGSFVMAGTGFSADRHFDQDNAIIEGTESKVMYRMYSGTVNMLAPNRSYTSYGYQVNGPMAFPDSTVAAPGRDSNLFLNMGGAPYTDKAAESVFATSNLNDDNASNDVVNNISMSVKDHNIKFGIKSPGKSGFTSYNYTQGLADSSVNIGLPTFVFETTGYNASTYCIDNIIATKAELTDLNDLTVDYWNADTTKMTLDLNAALSAADLKEAITVYKDSVPAAFTVTKLTAKGDAANTYAVKPEGGFAENSVYTVAIAPGSYESTDGAKLYALSEEYSKSFKVKRYFTDEFDYADANNPWHVSDTEGTLSIYTDENDNNMMKIDALKYAQIAPRNTSEIFADTGKKVSEVFAAESEVRSLKEYTTEVQVNDDVTTIVAEDFVRYENNAIYYSKNNDMKKLSLSSPYGVICNGRAMNSWENSVFNITDGDITVVSGAGSMDYVIINNYETWFTSAVDYEHGKIFNTLGNDMISFDDYEYITIYKEDGTLGTVEDIVSGMVINVSRSQDVVIIYLCNKKEVITIGSISYLNGETILEAEDAEYAVAEIYQNYAKRLDYKIGDEVTLYTNKFGKVAWMVNGAVTDLHTGYVFASTFGGQGFENELGFKIYDVAEQKEFIYFTNPEKIRVSNNKGEESNLVLSSFWSQHGNYRGIVRYSLDKDGFLSYIEYPITDLRYEKENKLKLIAELDSVNYNTNNFGGKALANASTKVICVDPDNAETEDGYSINSVSSLFSYSDGKKYSVTCYGVGKDSVLSTHVVYKTATRAGSINITPTTHVYMGVVKKIYSTYDDDEGVVDAMDILGFKNSSSSAGTDTVIKLRDGVIPTTILKHEFNGQVEPGDVIVYGMDREGYVNEIRILWDENAVNPDSPGGARGMLTDCKGFYGTGADEPSYDGSDLFTGDTTKLPNPMSIETKANLDGKEHAKNSSSFAGGPFLVHYGFPARSAEGTVIITAQDITVEEFDPTGLDGKHLVRAWNIPTNVISVELSGKNKVTAAYGGNAALNPVRSNEIYKSDCSRIITISAYGLISMFIVFNGSFE